MSIESDLTEAGWVRVGSSPFWKAPDDNGPTGRKWHYAAAHSEAADRAARKAAEKAAEPPPPRSKPKTSKR